MVDEFTMNKIDFSQEYFIDIMEKMRKHMMQILK